MKQFKQYIYAALVVIMATTTTSCLEDELISKHSESPIRISATTQFSGINSRAILDESNMEVENYCLVYFNDIKNTGTLISVQDLGKLDTPQYVYLPTSSDTGFLAILLGNVTRNDLEQQGLKPKSTTVKDFKGMVSNVSKNDNQPTDSKKFTWSGYLPVNHDTENLAFKVNPNVAKITATITNSSSQSEVINVQIKDVVSTVRYGQNALSKASLFQSTDNTNLKKVEGSNNYEQINYINYEIEELNLAKDESKTISWYVPHNECGEGSRPKDGNAGSFPANQKPTYIEIDGKRSVDYMDVAYKIYPGTGSGTTYENLDNFNILADNQYTLNITIADDGVTYNSVSQQNQGNTSDIYVEKIILPPLNNCYMIHPKYSDSVNPAVPVATTHNTTVYELPIYERINEYWGTNWGVEGLGNNTDNVIGDNTEWKMEVIWQDINARAIYFCDEHGNGELDIYSGIGKNPVYFKLDRNTLTTTKNRNYSTDTKKDIYGNILVGVKKVIGGVEQDGYLWSWHLWLTDYTPNTAPTYTAGSKLLYVLSNNQQGYPSHDNGGTMIYDDNIQHFYDTSNLWTGSTSPNVWNTGGIYANKWIMDRNLGAQSPSNMRAKDPVEAFGMYYQFGRKDPFPFHGATLQQSANHTTTNINYYKSEYKLYKIDGSTATTWEIGADSSGKPVGASYNTATNNPIKFYAYDATGDGMTWTTTPNANPWFNPKSVSKNQKLLFDPCPPGWTLPYQDAFEFTDRKNSASSVITKGTSYVYSSNSAGATHGELRCNTLVNIASTVSPTSLYISLPASGYISPQYANLYAPILSDARGYMWFADGYLNNNQRLGLGFGYASNQNASAGDNNTSNNFVFKIYSRPVYTETFSTSRGQNVRCIQIPD